MPGMHWSTGPSDPWLEGKQQDMYDAPQPIGYAGKYYKRLLKQIGSGEDVSSMPALQTMRDTFANQRAAIDDSYMTGANKMLAEGGGDNALLMNRMRQYETDKQSQQEGQASATALTGLSEQAGRGFQTAYDSANNREVQQRSAALNNRLGYYADRNKSYISASGWDKFKDVAGMLGFGGH